MLVPSTSQQGYNYDTAFAVARSTSQENITTLYILSMHVPHDKHHHLTLLSDKAPPPHAFKCMHLMLQMQSLYF